MATSSTASQSVSQPSNAQLVLKRNSKDVGWDYGMLIDGMNMDKVKCIKCGKIMSGGIYRLKQHIAHIPGNVAPCSNASNEDQVICRNAINEAKLKRRKKKDVSGELQSHVNVHADSIEEEVHAYQLQESLGATKLPCILDAMDKLADVINPESSIGSGSKFQEQNINDALFKQRIDSVKEFVCRWVYEAGISFNSIELDSFKLMVEAIGQFGPGFVPPTRYEMAIPFLKKEVDRTTNLLKTHEEAWKLYGCSVMTYAWRDKNRSIVNLCANSILGTAFLSSKDFPNIAPTSEVIFEYVDKYIEHVGPDNVVQVVTVDTSNNMGASKLLKEKRPKIFWTSCAAHTINLMLEAIAKQSRFKKVIDQAKALTVFLYAHHRVLEMMRAHIKQMDIVKPGVTRFASTFLTLQSLHDNKSKLKMMFGSREWEECKFSKSAKGKMAYVTAMSLRFWNDVTLCLQVFTPLIKVFQIVDCDRKSSMGFVYGELLKAKEDIKVALNNVPKNYKSIIEVIDERMKGRLDSPLHLMAYGLNPYYHYKDPLLHWDQDVSIAVVDCVDVLFHGDDDMQVKIFMEELPKYTKKSSTFGKSIAAKTCSLNDANFDPVTWWSTFGAITPNLQRLAMRILSQATSSSSCERKWDAFEWVHGKKGKELSATLLKNLELVQFNARLLNNQKGEKNSIDIDELFSHDATNAQQWILDRIDDEEEGEDESRKPKYRAIRELYDDFESEDEEAKENKVEHELDEGGVLEDLNI